MTRQDLITLIRAQGLKRPPRRRSRRMLQPDSQRLRYFAALRNGVLKDLRALVDVRLLSKLQRFAAQVAGLRQDAPGDFDEGDLHDTIDQLAEELAKKWTSKRFAQTVQPFAQDTARFSREQLQAVLKDQLGVDVVASEPWLEAEVAKWTARNVTLIKDIPRQALSQIETRLAEGLHTGERWEDLAKVVQERLGVAESRANLIARDQTGKLMGQLNEKRMRDLGVTGYIWRTMNDNRVRDEHEDREGVPFKWGELGADEEPGQPVQCRCYAEPDLGDVFKEAFG